MFISLVSGSFILQVVIVLVPLPMAALRGNLQSIVIVKPIYSLIGSSWINGESLIALIASLDSRVRNVFACVSSLFVMTNDEINCLAS